MPKVYGRKKKEAQMIQSLWPNTTRTAFETLRDIPWLSMAAIGTVLGGVLLFLYFGSIDYVPTDIAAIVGLGGAVAFAAGGLIFVTAICLVFPAAIYQNYAEDEKDKESSSRRLFTLQEFLLLQLGGLGFLFLHSAYGIYRECGIFSLWLLSVGALLIVPVVYVIACIVSYPGKITVRLYRAYLAISLMIFSLMPMIFFPAIAEAYGSSSFADLNFMVLVWLVFVVANTIAAIKLNRGVIFLSVLLTAVVAMPVAMAMDESDFFPALVAATVGVRSAGQTDLLISSEGCRLTRAALKLAGHSMANACDETSWSQIRAQVLSNVGGRWLIELQEKADQQEGRQGLIRVTLPDSSVQYVRVGPYERAKGYSSCKKKDSS